MKHDRAVTRAELQKKLEEVFNDARTMNREAAILALRGIRDLSKFLDDTLHTVIAAGHEPDLETYRYTKMIVGRVIRLLRARARARS